MNRSADSEHLAECGHETDAWSIHVLHDDGCEGSGWCVCPEVCEACCPSCAAGLGEHVPACT